MIGKNEKTAEQAITEELADIRRRLGPYTALQRDEAYLLNDAEIARALVRVTKVVDSMARDHARLLDIIEKMLKR